MRRPFVKATSLLLILSMAVYISVSFLDAGSSGSATAQGQVVESSAFTRSAGSFKAGGYERIFVYIR